MRGAGVMRGAGCDVWSRWECEGETDGHMEVCVICVMAVTLHWQGEVGEPGLRGESGTPGRHVRHTSSGSTLTRFDLRESVRERVRDTYVMKGRLSNCQVK